MVLICGVLLGESDVFVFCHSCYLVQRVQDVVIGWYGDIRFRLVSLVKSNSRLRLKLLINGLLSINRSMAHMSRFLLPSVYGSASLLLKLALQHCLTHPLYLLPLWSSNCIHVGFLLRKEVTILNNLKKP